MITFEKLSYRHPGSDRDVLHEVDLTIPEGDLCLVVGATGSGKSTLLGTINGLVPHFSGGTMRGHVLVDGHSTAERRPRDLAEVVGYVGQNPLASFVTDRVEDEIAYGMEQLGLSPTAMRKRVEETLDLMGIADLRRRPLLELSGGQQQRVAIAAVLAAQPRVVVLDEPTSALDPTAAQDVLSSITTLVHEVGLTVVLAEHRLERVMHAADSVLWLAGDGSVVHGPASQVLAGSNVRPPLSRIAEKMGWNEVPLSVRDARRRVVAEQIRLDESQLHVAVPASEAAPVASVRKLVVRYDDVVAVNGLDLDLAPGQVAALMGRNGAGKSTLMWALQGATSSSGTITVDGQDPRKVSAPKARELVTLVPQNATDLLYLPTVAEECEQADKESGVTPGTTAAILHRLGMDVEPSRSPRDLSEGQRLALVLAIQLSARPRVVLLDEPTRGLDYAMKDHLVEIISELSAAGTAVLVSTHDVEFAAAATNRTILMADGDIIADGPTREICTSSPAFAPQTAKVFRPAPVLRPEELVRASARRAL